MTFKKNSNNKKPSFLIVIGLFILISVVLVFLNERQVIEQEQSVVTLSDQTTNEVQNQAVIAKQTVLAEAGSTTTKQRIDELTAERTVVTYLQTYKKLPKYYITKRQAQNSGWDARRGNLCEVVPGKAIGGDRFNNREKSLPIQHGRIWYEADINYRCGRRGADRVLYSSDGLIYITQDHYQHFRPVKG